MDGEVVFKAHGLRSMGRLFCYLVPLQLANKDAAGVGWIATVEGEQQIQSWEAEGINLWAAAFPCASDYVKDAITVAIANANSNATGEIFCIGIKLG